MPRRQSSFARALSDATKRLEKAQAELANARITLAELEDEIPALQRTIAALQQHMGQKLDRVVFRNSKTGVETPPRAMTPEELAKWYTEHDLSGAGSIPPGGEKPAVQQLSEDELLPDDLPGRPILEK